MALASDRMCLHLDQQYLHQYLYHAASLVQEQTHFHYVRLPKLQDLEIQIYPSLPSTNRALWELASQSTLHGTVAIALQQSEGKGQFSRSWQSLPGGLYLSLGLRLHLPGTEAARLTFGVAWGLATVMRHHSLPIQLKWPNDLLLLNHKVGGILTETRLNSSGRIHQTVIGIGLNWANPVPPTGIALQPFLRSHPQAIPTLRRLEDLAVITLEGLFRGLHQWLTPLNSLAVLLPEYEHFLFNRGQDVVIRGNLGKVLGVTSDGRLRVQIGEQEHKVQPGELRLPICDS